LPETIAENLDGPALMVEERAAVPPESGIAKELLCS
jgi:hypothetical protein